MSGVGPACCVSVGNWFSSSALHTCSHVKIRWQQIMVPKKVLRSCCRSRCWAPRHCLEWSGGLRTLMIDSMSRREVIIYCRNRQRGSDKVCKAVAGKTSRQYLGAFFAKAIRSRCSPCLPKKGVSQNDSNTQWLRGHTLNSQKRQLFYSWNESWGGSPTINGEILWG